MKGRTYNLMAHISNGSAWQYRHSAIAQKQGVWSAGYRKDLSIVAQRRLPYWTERQGG
jgi:hypothetical protein